MTLNLNDREWREFLIKDLFSISIGKNIDGNKINKYGGRIAYITRKENNNGLDGFINFDKNYLNSFHPVITIGNETAEPFVQNYPFFTGTKVNILAPKTLLSKDTLQFICMSLKMHKSKYSYSYTINSSRLKNQKILLPIDGNDKPDYDFMEQYMCLKEKEKSYVYINFIKKRISKIKNTSIVSLSDKEWGEFFIEDVAKIQSGERLTKADMIRGNIPFIGATDSNNGITGYVANTNSSIDENILGVNYNGSVVENFYHPYKAVFSDDVKRLSLKRHIGNKYLYLFLKVIILQQKSKYQYGYKFNGQRIIRQKIMLPIDSKGNPDYEYMEQYMINIEYTKLKTYIDYKN